MYPKASYCSLVKALNFSVLGIRHLEDDFFVLRSFPYRTQPP